MEKRLFEILDDMNQDDTKNNSRLVEVSSNFVSANKVKQGAIISMGTPEASLLNIVSGNKIAMLILVDKEEYFKRKNQ